jgi:predicted phosphodiesterase
VILANHFPFFEQESIRKALTRSTQLKQQLARFSNVKLYLHGHTHRHCIADLRPNNLPIILDSGSTSNRETGSWNLIDISPKNCEVHVYRRKLETKENEATWLHADSRLFTW